MTRKELITKKTFWIEIITNTLYSEGNMHTSKAESVAEIIVNKHFMSLIKELTGINHK